jgi:hypothetical protein
MLPLTSTQNFTRFGLSCEHAISTASSNRGSEIGTRGRWYKKSECKTKREEGGREKCLYSARFRVLFGAHFEDLLFARDAVDEIVLVQISGRLPLRPHPLLLRE